MKSRLVACVIGLLLPPLGGVAIAADTAIAATNSAIVQMLFPGFTVRELPVRLTALNNVEYAPDGRLFAAGYDGRFHLLQDRDGDGVEEHVETFWSSPSEDYPLGMVVKDGMPHALLSDAIIRFRDTNGDGVPERREVVVSGWDDPTLKTNSLILHRRVDSAMGLAAGPDGSWYVTMGSANPANGYWQDESQKSWDPNAKKAGTPRYSTNVLRGCLLRIDPNGKVTRLNSGLRYVMSLQWNEHGDLFGTDQEGATWLPNGNPFDELLHLQEGRHYGFPPRHPVLLPDVIDEPSVWDYAPQHQSVCGFRFNGPRPGFARFGPAHWAYDAILTGASRGKLWRTKLGRTAAGYVAQTELIAALGMIAVDCALSPRGELIVACHDGPPDWGSGPAALGRVFKISYTEGKPVPVATWAESETETRIEFDRPLAAMPSVIRMEAGRHVYPADRLERFRPGYVVVKMQMAEPRTVLPVEGVELRKQGRELWIRTPKRTEAVNYAITLGDSEGGSPIDVGYSLTGVAFTWEGQGNRFSGWLPHLDLQACRAFSTDRHRPFFAALNSAGTLELNCQLDLEAMLRPVTQPGSKLDYEPEPEVITVVMDADTRFAISDGSGELTSRHFRHELTITNGSPAAGYLPLRVELETPVRRFDVSFHTDRDRRLRPLGLQRLLAPFAQPAPTFTRGAEAPEIAGADWKKGKELFFGKAACSTCHQIRGEGHAVGPDLTNLIYRDYASVLRDIREPSATINPDAIAYTITTRDGMEWTGVRTRETETELTLVIAGGVVTAIRKSDITGMEASQLSLMPEGIMESLTEQEGRDLMKFLLTESE